MSNKSTYQRALVVEDDLWMQPLISMAIQSAIPGISIDWVESAEEAIRKARCHAYSVIIADINLKPNRETGLDFWYSCREECPEIPVLLTSSIPVEVFAKKMGLYGPPYLPKPFSVTQCKDVIQGLVSHSGLSS
jgi:DNA-binding NtrC family response regulator